MTQVDVEEHVLRMLTEKFGSRPRLDESFAEIGVDSVGMAELMFEMEKTFSVKMDSGMFEIDTPGQLVQYLLKRIES